jgi:hypothetical protein
MRVDGGFIAQWAVARYPCDIPSGEKWDTPVWYSALDKGGFVKIFKLHSEAGFACEKIENGEQM